MTITAANGTPGTGQLARVVVLPYPRENLSVRATAVQVRDNAGVLKVETGPRLRTTHLVAPDATASRKARAAAKDAYGCWTEWGPEVTLTLAAFTPGTTVGSIASGAATTLTVEEPGVVFPDLSFGSGQVAVHRTAVATGFYDEVRRAKHAVRRYTFRVVVRELMKEQAEKLRQFFQALNGPFKPFLFDYTDPKTGKQTRHAVRFRDDTYSDSLFGVTYAETELNLIELTETSDAVEL